MRYDYPPIRPGDARDPGEVTLRSGAFAALAADATPENFADEGIDQYVLTPFGRAEVVERIVETTRSASALAASGWATLVFSGTTFKTGSIVLAAEEVLDVRARVELNSTKSSGQGLSQDATFGIRLASRVAPAAAVGKDSTTRRRTPGLSAKGAHARLSTRGLFYGPQNLSWVELQYILTTPAGTDCFPVIGSLSVMRYRRTSA